jgi:hemolysin III
MSIVVDLPSPLPKPVELANSLTHGIGLALAVVGTGVLVEATARYGDGLQIAGVAIYGATLIAVYAASTLSHAVESPRRRHFFRTVDQVCIFLLIAGTFTPVSLTFFRHGWWWALLISMWAVSLVGIFAKIFYTRLHNVAVSAYVLNGWLPVVAIKPIIETAPGGALAWMLIGGVFYTAGTVFLMRDERVPIFHAVWHVFVIAGSACHYYAMYQWVVPWPV